MHFRFRKSSLSLCARTAATTVNVATEESSHSALHASSIGKMMCVRRSGVRERCMSCGRSVSSILVALDHVGRKRTYRPTVGARSSWRDTRTCGYLRRLE